MQDNIYKYRLKVTKKNALRFISHLDWQNLILKIFRRMELDLVLSEGFNKMPKVSYSPALPLFVESVCELINFQVKTPLKDNFLDEFKLNSPLGLEIVSLKEQESSEPKSLENYCQWAKYESDLSSLIENDIYNQDKIRYIIDNCLSSDEFLIEKKTKKGILKTVNYRNSIKNFELDGHFAYFILKVGQNDAIPALRSDEFLKILFGDECVIPIKRIEFFDSDMRVIG